jgi:5-hydroxyisourate hydrolase-like protein (transthyretin family)
MSRLTLLLTALLLCLVASPAAVVAQNRGIIEGQLVNATGGALPESIADLEVALYRVVGESTELLATATSDHQGRFRFEDVDTDPARVYRTQMEYRGVECSSESAFPPGDTVLHLVVTIHETTASDHSMVVNRHHVVAEFASDALLLQEMYILHNTGDTTYVGGERTTVRFSLPDGATNLTFRDPAMESSLVRTDDSLAFVRPITPGQSEVLYAYRVPYDGSQITLSRRVLYPTGYVDVLVANLGVHVESQQLMYQGLTGGKETSYLHFGVGDLPAGAEVDLLISGAPQGAAVPVPARLSWSQGLQEVGPAIALTMGLLGALLAFAQLRWRRGSKLAPGQRVDPTVQRGELLRLIADLDDAFAEDRLDQQAYEQLRTRLKQRLRNVWTNW